MSKFIPFGSRESWGLRIQVQAYNIFNHTEFDVLKRAIQFNATGQITNGSSVGVSNSTLPARGDSVFGKSAILTAAGKIA